MNSDPAGDRLPRPAQADRGKTGKQHFVSLAVQINFTTSLDLPPHTHTHTHTHTAGPAGDVLNADRGDLRRETYLKSLPDSSESGGVVVSNDHLVCKTVACGYNLR